MLILIFKICHLDNMHSGILKDLQNTDFFISQLCVDIVVILLICLFLNKKKTKLFSDKQISDRNKLLSEDGISSSLFLLVFTSATSSWFDELHLTILV